MINWLNQYSDMTSAKIYDWLAEKYGDDVSFAERTLRDHVAELCLIENIPKVAGYRQYEAVVDSPMYAKLKCIWGRFG